MPSFDRSDLPEADLEFVVIADTHHLVDPGMYKAKGDSVTPEIVREWSDRGDWALALAKATETALVFHVGDLAQEYPGSRFFDTGRRAAVTQFEESGLEVNFAAGNMDIGDKPDPTVPAGWVEPGFLKRWDEDFGKSFFSRTAGDSHFIVLNSQIMNTTLPEAIEQREWVEADLAAHASCRIFMFMHLPPYLVDEDEPGLGSYDVLDNPDRAWLLDLCRRYEVEAVFSGHTHFQVFNRAGDTRLYTLPSTTTTRPGFYEAFNVRPADRGWIDTTKLGFFLVRVRDGATSVHLIRTSGETHAHHLTGTRILSGTITDLPHSPAGAYLRLPITNKSDGAISYPNHVRHRIRDDYPLLGCVEAGIRHVRFPIHDLDVDLQNEQLAVLRGDGAQLTATVLCPKPGDITAAARKASDADFIEVQLTNRFFPDGEDLAALAELREAGVGVALAPLALEDTGKVHMRSRTGYRPRELPRLDDLLTDHGVHLDRAVCMIDDTEPVWSEIRSFDTELRSIGGLDFLVPMGTDDQANALAAAEAMFAAATMAELPDLSRSAPGSRPGDQSGARAARPVVEPSPSLPRDQGAEHGAVRGRAQTGQLHTCRFGWATGCGRRADHQGSESRVLAGAQPGQASGGRGAAAGDGHTRITQADRPGLRNIMARPGRHDRQPHGGPESDPRGSSSCVGCALVLSE